MENEYECPEEDKALRESEERLRVMLESIADGIAVIDLDSRIIDMNPVMLRLYGYDTKAEAIGRSAFEFISAKDQSRARDNMAKTLQEGYSGNLEITLHNRHGKEYEAEVSAAPLRDRDGAIVGFIAITKDITERKRSEEALRRAEELNRTLVETAGQAGEGLAVLQNTEGGEAVCIFANEEFARILGYPVDELVGRPVPRSIPPQIRAHQSIVPEAREHTAEERPARFEIELDRRDGQTIPVDIGFGATTYQGAPATVVYVTDISERKRQEDENLQLQETLRFYSTQVVKASKELLRAIRELHARESMVRAKTGPGLPKRPPVPQPDPVRIDEVEMLTPREIQVLQIAARGLSNKDIADELGLAVRTVKGHLINIYAKMKVRSRTEAVSCALKEGWIRLEDIGQEID